MPISAKSLIYKAIAYAQGIVLYSYTGIPGIAPALSARGALSASVPKALRALDSYRCRPPVALHCAQMPSNGPNRPATALQCLSLGYPIAAGTAAALGRSEPFAILLH